MSYMQYVKDFVQIICKNKKKIFFNSRSSSRSLKNNEKKPERNRRDSAVGVHIEHDIVRKDNNNIPYESLPPNIRNRERRDSHRSNRSSTIGNSRDDLDRWRSLRSYSREQSTDG